VKSLTINQLLFICHLLAPFMRTLSLQAKITPFIEKLLLSVARFLQLAIEFVSISRVWSSW
jgi:hypothetical protein